MRVEHNGSDGGKEDHEGHQSENGIGGYEYEDGKCNEAETELEEEQDAAIAKIMSQSSSCILARTPKTPSVRQLSGLDASRTRFKCTTPQPKSLAFWSDSHRHSSSGIGRSLTPQPKASSSKSKQKDEKKKKTKNSPRKLDDLTDSLKFELAQLRKALGEASPREYREFLRQIRFVLNASARGDIKRCIQNYKDARQLRIKHNCAGTRRRILRHGLQNCVDQSRFPHSKKILGLFPHFCHLGHDIFGQPIAYVPLRHLNIHQILKDVSKEEYFEYELHRWEYMDAVLASLSEQTGYLTQWVILVDMKNFTNSLISTKGMSFLKEPHNILNRIHKELLGPIIVINAPKWYSVLWSIAKYFVTERTRTKVTVYGGDYASKLQTVIPPEDYGRLIEAIQRCDRAPDGDWNADSKGW
eukprot:CAMPEP_0114489326 /NCGR_PEP_ID=MMETSP0109-20121206/1832_1 /TAXON_ID=29199 /ORGANISM="Chlorarachnion reptans, Strain CCCM449" /LENGTH=412 /DNA_ID=CAMNT_0001665835 /DNA_START=132 /DNA_END=1367 /DNA_ORIENTATION=-